MDSKTLFWIYLKTGFFTIGGGMAAVPILQEELVSTHMGEDAFLSMIAISQSAPGSIGANMASYTGTLFGGLGGAFVAVLGLVLPSFLVITLIARFFPRFSKKESVQGIFIAVRPAVTGLILSVALSLTLAVLWGGGVDAPLGPIGIFTFILILHFRFKLQSISLIGIGALCGVLFL